MPKDQILVFSRCLELKESKHGLIHYKFHFNGVYRGEKIKFIVVQASSMCNIVVNDDYLLLLKAYTIENGVLLTSLLKSRNIQ